MNAAVHKKPAIHNAMWPGLVGKGPDSEPAIDLETMLDLTAAAEVDGLKFDGVDLFASLPHIDIDSTKDDLAWIAESIRRRNLVLGSLVAPVWPPTGGGSAMGSEEDRKKFLTQVKKTCAMAKRFRDLGVRHYGVVRIDSSTSPAEWAKDPAGNMKKIAVTFREAATIAESYGERLAVRARSVGAGCMAGSTWSIFWNWSDGRRRWDSRRTWLIRFCTEQGYNSPESRLLPKTSIGRKRMF